MIEVCDPLRLELLSFFRDAIRSELDAAWVKIAQGVHKADGYSINEILPFAPAQHLTLSTPFRFPLLALYRDKGSLTPDSQGEAQKTTLWVLEYILPPLDLMGIGKLEAARTGVELVLCDVFKNASHDDANDGYSLESLGLVHLGELEITYGDWEVPSDDSLIVHPVLIAKFSTVEMTGFSDDYPSTPFDGADVETSIGIDDPFHLHDQELNT